MSILTEKLPLTVWVGGREYQINSDFRISIRFEELMQTPLEEAQRILTALELYYPEIPRDIAGAVQQMLWFYRCGKCEENGMGKSFAGNPVYSFEHDAGYIYAAFLDQYHVDLQTANLHWWQFRAMFQALREENEIVKIMGYRAVKIDSKMSKSQKEFYTKMKKQYAIPLPKEVIAQVNELEEALLAGGDVSKILK